MPLDAFYCFAFFLFFGRWFVDHFTTIFLGLRPLYLRRYPEHAMDSERMIQWWDGYPLHHLTLPVDTQPILIPRSGRSGILDETRLDGGVGRRRREDASERSPRWDTSGKDSRLARSRPGLYNNLPLVLLRYTTQ